MIDGIKPGKYGEFEIIKNNFISHSRKTFRGIHEFIVKYGDEKFAFIEGEDSTCSVHQPKNVELYLLNKYMEHWFFPVKSGFLFLKAEVAEDFYSKKNTKDGIPPIPEVNLFFEKDDDCDGSFYLLKKEEEVV